MITNRNNMIQRKADKWEINDDSPTGKTEEKNYEQFKRAVITIISDDGLITPNQTLDDYRNKLKLIIDVL